MTAIFDKIAALIHCVSSFRKARKVSRDLFASEFEQTGESDKLAFASFLFQWSHDKLRSRQTVDRLSALVGFSFFIDITDDHMQLLIIMEILERFLPVDSVCLVDGIAHLIKRISRRGTAPVIPRVLERAVSHVSSRSTRAAVVSAVVLVLKLSPFDRSIFNSSHISTLLAMPLALEIEEIVDVTIDLLKEKMLYEPAVEECLSEYITTIMSRLRQNSVPVGVHGIMKCLMTLVDDFRDVCVAQSDVIFSIVTDFLAVNHEERYMEIIAFLCEKMTTEAMTHSGPIVTLFKSNQMDFGKPVVCRLFGRVVKAMPEFFRELSVEVMNVLSVDRYNCFLIVVEAVICVTPDLVDRERVFVALEKGVPDIEFLDAATAFARVFSEDFVKIVAIWMTHENVDRYVRLYGLYKCSLVSQVSLVGHWDFVHSCFISGDDRLTLSAVPAIIALLKQSAVDKQMERLVNVLFYAQSSSNNDMKCLLLDGLRESMMDLMIDESVFHFVKHFCRDVCAVSRCGWRLVRKICEVGTVSHEDFFDGRLGYIDEMYLQVYEKGERVVFVTLLSEAIRAAGMLVARYEHKLSTFLFSLLVEDHTPRLFAKSLPVTSRDSRDDRYIKILALKAFTILWKTMGRVLNGMANMIVDHMMAMVLTKNRKVQLAVVKTLRSLFRYFPSTKLSKQESVVELQDTLLRLVGPWTDFDLSRAILRLLGTIGALEPHKFQKMSHVRKVAKEIYPVYSRTRREQTYLCFVMEYLLAQLNGDNRMHDTSIVINAVLHIFQSDPAKCKKYLESVVKSLKCLLDAKGARIPQDGLLHFFRSLVLTVDIEILPFSDDIYRVLLPFMHQKPCLTAVKLLSSLVFVMKTAFLPQGPTTMLLLMKLLKVQDRYDDYETVIYILHVMTLIAIYAEGEIVTFLKTIMEWGRDPADRYTEFVILCIGQVMRCRWRKACVVTCLNFVLNILGQTTDESTRKIAVKLMYLVVLHYRDNTLMLPMDLVGIDVTIDELINNAEKERYHNDSDLDFLQEFDPIPDPFPVRSKPPIEPFTVSRVFERSELQSHVSGNDWPAWILRLSQELVLCSHSPAIRACHPLLSFSSEFEQNMFPFIILSVWDDASPDDQELLSGYLLAVVRNAETPHNVLVIIASACEWMDRATCSLFQDPFEIGQLAERCGWWFTALRFFEKCMDDGREAVVSHLVRIHSILKRRESVNALLGVVSFDLKCSSYEALSMWNSAREIYAKQLEEDSTNESSFFGYLRCSASMEDWKTIMLMAPRFPTFSRELQTRAAEFFVAAARGTGNDVSAFVGAIKRDAPATCMWRSIVAIDQGFMDSALKSVDRGLVLLSDELARSVPGSYEPAIPSILMAMIFEEIVDIVKQRKGSVTSSYLFRIWNSKSDYIKHDVVHLRRIYRIRNMSSSTDEERLSAILVYVDLLRRSKEWQVFDNVFMWLLENVHDYRADILQAKARFDRGITTDLSEFQEIMNVVGSGSVYCDAACAFIRRSPVSVKGIGLLENVIRQQSDRVTAWKHWAYFNLRCIHNKEVAENYMTYASNAIIGFAYLITRTGPAMHYLCQLCSLFFKYGVNLTNSSAIIESLTSLSPSSVIQIIPQLIAQFDHPHPDVRRVLFGIVDKFAMDHIQALALPLCLLRRTPSSSHILLTFIERLTEEHYRVMHDAELFTGGMLRAAITAAEEVIVILEGISVRASREPLDDEALKEFRRVYALLTKRDERFVANIFDDVKISNFLNYLNVAFEQAVGGSVRLLTPQTVAHLDNSTHVVKACLQQHMDAATTIDIDEMKLNLCDSTPLALAIPGSYVVDREPATIQSIGNVLKLLPSAKRPRKLRIVGSDGCTYKYLLKGHEDLRLDQRVMQLFSLTNSILREDKFGVERHLHIRLVPVVPLAPDAGLIVWAEGGETIYSMIAWHRRMFGKDPNAELVCLRKFLGNGRDAVDRDMTLHLTPPHKLELFRHLCSLTSDDDIRETMWIRSQSAELWLGRTTHFARSSGLMSIIGYIMGIGDRHPSNILIMKSTGNVVHIDFSDCFEKASLRSFVRETVPFRLTRMMTKAMGATGIGGVFSMTAEYVMGLMRRNKETLLAFLDIFVQDPITDAIWYNDASGIVRSGLNMEKVEEDSDNAFKRALGRVSDKLTGRELGHTVQDVHGQVEQLLGIATSDLNLSQMYYGWAPFW